MASAECVVLLRATLSATTKTIAPRKTFLTQIKPILVVRRRAAAVVSSRLHDGCTIRAGPCRLLGAPPERTEGGRVAFPPPRVPTTGPCNRTASSTARPGLAASPSKIVQGIAGSGCRASRVFNRNEPTAGKKVAHHKPPSKKEARRLVTFGLKNRTVAFPGRKGP